VKIRVDDVIRSVAGVTVVGLAGISGAISYSHMKHLAHLHGETGWRAHMFPLSVDGIEIVASLVLLADKRAGRRSGWLPWTALAAGTAASLAANVAVGGSDWIGRAVSGWPALAMLVAVKLLSGLLDHPVSVPGGTGPFGTVPDGPELTNDDEGTVPAPNHSADDVTASVDGKGHAREGTADQSTAQVIRPSSEVPPAKGLPADIALLLPAARSARRGLLASGKTLTRETLARQLRAEGTAVSNARVSALLKILVAEPVEPGTKGRRS
jgi:hypothetical protein